MKPRSVDALTRTAFHEAGHAVLSTILDATPELVSIRPNATTLGRIRHVEIADEAARTQLHLAGFAAEHILTGRRARQLDMEMNFAIFARHDDELRAAFAGVEDTDGHKAVHAVLAIIAVSTDEDLKAEVDRFYEMTLTTLRAVWKCIVAVAEALLSRVELDREQVMAITGSFLS